MNGFSPQRSRGSRAAPHSGEMRGSQIMLRRVKRKSLGKVLDEMIGTPEFHSSSGEELMPIGLLPGAARSVLSAGEHANLDRGCPVPDAKRSSAEWRGQLRVSCKNGRNELSSWRPERWCISGHDRSGQRLEPDDVHDPCQITPSCGGHAPTAERTLIPARTYLESLDRRPGIREQPGSQADEDAKCRDFRFDS
jgi:hypothetical protein